MLRATVLTAFLLCACGGGAAAGPLPDAPIVVPPCHVEGCSAHVCTEQDDLVTTCDWRPEYACYRSARCEPQADGRCGWTQTPELLACIESASGE